MRPVERTWRRRGIAPALAAMVLAWASCPASGQEPEPPHRFALLPGLRARPAPEPARPTVADLGKRIDHVAESIRNDGVVALKQPDVYSQARLTKYRQDFENEMLFELGTFKMILSARIGRLDSATTTSTTTLGAALSPPGSTSVNTPAAPTVPAFGAADQFDFKNTPFGNVTVGQAAGNLGVEPTVYLDEKKRFLDHLNEIRRISLGPDQNDSSGYGLYLLRMPVSITPGEGTFEGHGADLSVAIEHEFRPDFLPTTFRNLAVNDVVDEIGPVVYELVLAQGPTPPGVAPGQLIEQEARLKKDREANLEALAREFIRLRTPGKAAVDADAQKASAFEFRKQLGATSTAFGSYILRSGLNNRGAMALEAVADRLDALAAAVSAIQEEDPAARRDHADDALQFRNSAVAARGGADPAANLGAPVVETALYAVIRDLIPNPNANKAPRAEDSAALHRFLRDLYDAALTDDVAALNAATGAPAEMVKIARPLAASREQLFKVRASLKGLKARNLPSMRSPKQSYPIAPRELSRYFLAENLAILSVDARRALLTKTPRATDVRNYLRQSLYVAYEAMSRPLPPAVTVAGVPASAGPAPLEDIDFMDRLRDAIARREFAETADENDFSSPSPLRDLRDELVRKLSVGRANVAGQPIAALCWAIAVDATLLDAAFRDDARRTFAAAGLPCPDLDAVRFYDPDDDAARGVFHEYVRRRWPIVTFALDPVVDQQNIADSFNLKRDLQLALAFSFATGQINFNQVNTFRRQLDQASDTIALNRTVSGYTHGTDAFGFRFTPRFQNPPNQRTNFGVIASQLIAGGPGPDYGTKRSKLEPGIRELTAAVLVPGFLPTVRLQVAGNWFKLTDPEHLVVPTRRMMEQGRRVQELRGEFASVCNAQEYRAEDLRVLGAKINQVEAMLPQQSRVVLLPFASTASGFELFAEGATAMAPELSGFEGVDVYKPGTQSDIFIFGRYFSIHETHVIVGGVPLAKDAFAIVSREILQVRLPDKALTTTSDDGKVYVEVHVATPNGISNRLLVPIADDPASPAAPKVAGPPAVDSGTAPKPADPTPPAPRPAPPATPMPNVLPRDAAKPAFGPDASTVRPTADPSVRPTADGPLPPLPASATAAVPSAAAAMLLGLGPNPSAAEAAAIRARLAAPPVSLNPTTVVVVPPRPEPKKKDHRLRLFGKPRPSPMQPPGR